MRIGHVPVLTRQCDNHVSVTVGTNSAGLGAGPTTLMTGRSLCYARRSGGAVGVLPVKWADAPDLELANTRTHRSTS